MALWIINVYVVIYGDIRGILGNFIGRKPSPKAGAGIIFRVCHKKARGVTAGFETEIV